MRCTNLLCSKRYHSLIPSFSTPGCSTGVKELNQFITLRQKGASVSEAGQCFVDKDMSPEYPEFIHRRFKRLLKCLPLVFETETFSRNSYPQAIFDLAEPDTTEPVTDINRKSFRFGFNPVCFSRRNILLLPDFNPVVPFSYNPPSRPPPNAARV